MMPVTSFPQTQDATAWREAIDGALQRYTEFSAECPDRLREAIRYSLLGPGKRLRPRLVLLAAETCGGSLSQALPAACAVEMVHAYSLVHDDLPAMDDDALRRGRPTCHKVFGEALAVLAGDALLALAFQVLSREIEPAEAAARCCAELAEAAGATALVGGQADDLAVGDGADSREGPAGGLRLELAERIHRRKTGRLFVASLRLGGLAASARGRPIEALSEYGGKLGLAFQITDDLLDAVGEEDAVGKQVGKDGDRGRLTYPRLIGVEASRDLATKLVEEACQALDGFGERAEGLRALARSLPGRCC